MSTLPFSVILMGNRQHYDRDCYCVVCVVKRVISYNKKVGVKEGQTPIVKEK